MLPGRTKVTENTTGLADSLQFLVKCPYISKYLLVEVNVNLALLFPAANHPREFMVTLCDWLSPKVRQY